VRKAIFSAHLWQPSAARESADQSDVNSKSADLDRRLRIGWLNIRSLSKKTVAVRKAIESNNLDVLALTETWHQNSTAIFLRDAAPSDFAVVDAVWESQPDTEGLLCCTVDCCDATRSICRRSQRLKPSVPGLRLVVQLSCY